MVCSVFTSRFSISSAGLEPRTRSYQKKYQAPGPIHSCCQWKSKTSESMKPIYYPFLNNFSMRMSFICLKIHVISFTLAKKPLSKSILVNTKTQIILLVIDYLFRFMDIHIQFLPLGVSSVGRGHLLTINRRLCQRKT